MCRSCKESRDKEAYIIRLANADLVEDYDGWVFTEEVNGEDDGYFESADAFVEWCDEWNANAEEADKVDVPEYVFCCNPSVFRIDVANVIESAERAIHADYCEDWKPNYQGMQELEEAIRVFNERNKHICTWWADTSRKVAVSAGNLE